jgi:hypothetical protein
MDTSKSVRLYSLKITMGLIDERRTELKKIVIICLIVFVLLYGLFMYLKYFKPDNKQRSNTENNSIIFTQPTLQIFSYKETLTLYPDRVLMHYPYFIVVKPDDFKSTIYNIETKKKEKTVPEIVLDFYKGNTLYNKQCYDTYYNDKKLGLLCDQAFIKSATEILCITRPDKNQIANKLIAINHQTLEIKDVYKSQNVLTAMYYDKSILYVGEYGFKTKKAYLTVNGKTFPAIDLINIIYPMNNSIYLASFKSQRNNLKESFAEYNAHLSKINNIDNNKIIFKND